MESSDSQNTCFLSCRVCYKNYECGHSFCKECLDIWNKPCKPCALGCLEVIADPQPNKTVIAILMRLEQIQADFKVLEAAVDRMIPENIKPKKEGFEEPTSSGHSNEESIGNPCVFVRRIPTNWTDRDVKSYFQQFGAIRTSSFNPSVRGSYVENRGMVMIEFSSSEEADRAIREANGRQVGMRRITVVHWVQPSQNPYPHEAFRQLSMATMTHNRTQ